jgi:hypothetical protein
LPIITSDRDSIRSAEITETSLRRGKETAKPARRDARQRFAVNLRAAARAVW